ncbi:MAG: hypothetical protein OXE41_10145 [Gammaproteobacteria bacterium]|nr:hypothetical protein [Gammaproteobacteria bacterium]MCY4275734.1 hypothetical protein [Gammaproteobacteria bacterium]
MKIKTLFIAITVMLVQPLMAEGFDPIFDEIQMTNCNFVDFEGSGPCIASCNSLQQAIDAESTFVSEYESGAWSEFTFKQVYGFMKEAKSKFNQYCGEWASIKYKREADDRLVTVNPQIASSALNLNCPSREPCEMKCSEVFKEMVNFQEQKNSYFISGMSGRSERPRKGFYGPARKFYGWKSAYIEYCVPELNNKLIASECMKHCTLEYPYGQCNLVCQDNEP